MSLDTLTQVPRVVGMGEETPTTDPTGWNKMRHEGVDFEHIDTGGGEAGESLEISAALIDYLDGNIMEDLLGLINTNTTLFVPAMPNILGSGDVPSNFRYKFDPTINNQVVDRWIQIFTEYNKVSNPVVITAVGRTGRYISLKMNEDGTNQIMNKKMDGLDSPKTDIFQQFIESFEINSEKMISIRESSSGARYNSYLADMMGFINIINWTYNKEMFTLEYLEAHKVNTTDVYHRKEVEGQFMLVPVVVNGREWVPKDGFNYLYFRKQDKLSPTRQKFMMFNVDFVDQLYDSMFQAMLLEENTIKSKIREYFNNTVSYSRYSDFWLNDVDDAFTILMIINCYRYVELTEQEQKIKEHFEQIATKIGL
tara:strand:- start:1346 stop:2446 length:1101 start_codon:yes stop_codon:yes gene_type:complete